MKKQLFTLLTLLVMCVTGAWADSEWIMANWSTGHTGLTYWVSGSSADIPSTSTDKNTPAWSDESTYNTYTATGGSSNFQIKNNALNKNRLFSFDVAANDVIKVYFMGGGTGNRSMYVSNNATTTERDVSTAFGSATADGYTPTILSATATTAGTVYLWCDANVRVYAIKVEASGPATAPTITTQPASATYMLNGNPAALTVAATASSGDLSYQWYKNTDQDKTAKESDKIAEATSSTLAAANISTSSTGTTYYYVVVKDGKGSTTSNLAAIEVVNGVAPEVSATISASTVRTGTKVTLTANVTAGVPAPTLQWYSCNSDGTGEVAINGATNTKYEFTPENVGTYYYKVKASNATGDAASDVKSLTVIAQGVAGTVDDLEAITSNYTFIADNHTGTGVVGFTAYYLYDDSRIFSPNGNSIAQNKGKSTIDGVEYYNSLRIKSNSQDVLAFKVGGACAITFYTENPQKNPARIIKVGNSVDDDSYGTISDANEAHVVIIPSAGTVYLTGTGDRFIAGFKVEFTVSATIGSTGYTTFASSYPLDLSNLPEGITAYTASVVDESEVTFTPATTAVAAGTGLLLKGTDNTPYDIPVAASGDAISGNKMVGCPAATDITPSESYYVLVNNNGTAEFRPLSGTYTNNKVTIPAGKAYLDVNAGTARALSIALDNEEVTGINNVQGSGVKTQGYFNLNGQRVSQPTKGLYIINGRKVVVK